MTRQFKDLVIGEVFRQCLGIESGLWESDKNKAGRYVYRKASRSTCECIGYGDIIFGDTDATANLIDEHFIDPAFVARFVEQAVVNRSGGCGPNGKVWP